MRSQFYESMNNLLPKDESSIFLGSDLGAGSLDTLKSLIGNRFLMEGVNEAHMVTMASGLSSQGYKVYCSTITAFLLRRSYEQVYLDIGCSNADVKLMGNGGGLVYAPLGTTHLAIEDISLIKNIPNIRIYTPLDKKQLEEMILLEHSRKGPAYFRLIKGAKKEYFSSDYNFDEEDIDTLINLKEKNVIAYGETCHMAYKFIKENNLDVGLVNIPMMRPLARNAILNVMKKSEKVICMEEHIQNGSLYHELLELKENKKLDVGVSSWNLPNQKLDHYGNQTEIINYYDFESKLMEF